MTWSWIHDNRLFIFRWKIPLTFMTKGSVTLRPVSNQLSHWFKRTHAEQNTDKGRRHMIRLKQRCEKHVKETLVINLCLSALGPFMHLSIKNTCYSVKRPISLFISQVKNRLRNPILPHFNLCGKVIRLTDV